MIIAPESISTPNLVIRSFDLNDGAQLSEAVNESYQHLRPFMPWAKPHQSRTQSQRVLRTFRGEYLLAHDFNLGVFSADGERLLGATAYHLRDGPLESQNAELGMWIRGSESGKGVGREVLRTMLNWGFSEWPWYRLSWKADAENAGAIRLAELCGLRHEGVLRQARLDVDGLRTDVHVYAALRDEWESNVG